MPLSPTLRSHVPRALIIVLVAAAPALAQPKTDVVTLANGDRITGEIVRLERGRVELKTDDAGKLYLEWEHLATVVAPNRQVEVLTTDGRRFLGSLGPSPPRQIAVVTAQGTIALPMQEVTLMRPIGRSFWSKLDGSIDAGFSYTKSSGVAQLNFNSDTVYKRPAAQGRLTASLTQTKTDDDSDGDDRGAVELSYLKYPWQRWFVVVAGRVETNESLGLILRSQGGVVFGPRLVNTNRTQLTAGVGLDVNRETGVDVPPTENLEAVATFELGFNTYDRPRTNVDVSAAYYASLTTAGRRRLQFDTSLNRELWSDLFVSLNMFDTFDSKPPNPVAHHNDIGVVLSIGWTY